MPRYSRQKTMSECGPVAILNILKWAGWKVTYDTHLPHLKRTTKYVYTDDFKGVKWYNIRRTLNRIGSGKLRVRMYLVQDLEVLKKHVANGGAFILRHTMTPTDMHYTTVVPAEKGKFGWINIGPKHTKTDVTPEVFERRVMRTHNFNSDTPLALLISKI